MTQTEEALRYAYGSARRYHLHHPHVICASIDITVAFYRRWFDAEVAWDGLYAGTRNVFMKIGVGAMHLYEKQIDPAPRNAVHHLGIQVAGLRDLYERMVRGGLDIPKGIREADGGGYFMLEAPDRVLLEIFEPGPLRPPEVLEYYGYAQP